MNAPAGTITIQQAARLLKLSDERVRQLSQAGYFQRVTHGRYPLVGVVQGYIRYRNERREKVEQATSSPLSEAKLATIERRMAREDKHLIAMDEALAAYDRATSIYIRSLRSLPDQIASDPVEKARIGAIVEIDVRQLEREFAIGRHRLVTGEDDAVSEDDE